MSKIGCGLRSDLSSELYKSVDESIIKIHSDEKFKKYIEDLQNHLRIQARNGHYIVYACVPLSYDDINKDYVNDPRYMFHMTIREGDVLEDIDEVSNNYRDDLTILRATVWYLEQEGFSIDTDFIYRGSFVLIRLNLRKS